MPTRYEQLRQAIATLSAPAEQQLAHLERIIGCKLSDDANVDELALEFDDMFCAVGHMRDYGEISQEEIDAARPLDDLLSNLSGAAHAKFWTCAALFSDARWIEVRSRAAQALAAFPNEQRTGWVPQ